ncbi:MAG: S41 family peptidase [Oscillospiraceae bacterium]|nr:S41 family peptidase [Oscillospiraceae bacterium]
MSKKLPLGITIIILLFAVLLTFQITYLSINNKFNQKLNELMLSQNLYSKLTEIDAYYRDYYIGELDETRLSDSIMRGYVAGTGDKHGNYLNSQQYKDYIADYTGSGVGIGVMVTYDYANGALEIATVMPDSPALKAGLRPGDFIVAVEGLYIYEIGYYEAVDRVKGEAGTYVNLTVYRYEDNEYVELDFNIARANVTYISVLSHMYDDRTTGIVKILKFDLHTPEEFISAVEDLIAQGAVRIVFDVRNNLGGELNSIHKVLDYLLPEGPVIRIIDKDGNVETMDSDTKELDMPMIVLINSRTASAAELFSAALRDYGKAELVGVKTYGKGSMQTVIPLADNSALIVSIRTYAPPFSDNYDGIGLYPDVEVELSKEAARQNEYTIKDADDNQLVEAIKILKSS